MIEPSPPNPEPELIDDIVDELPDRPWLRRIMKIIYIVIVLLVIVGLISLFFPWDRVDLPVDLPFQSPQRL